MKFMCRSARDIVCIHHLNMQLILLQELEKYRKQCERKARELAKQRAQAIAGPTNAVSRDRRQQK